MRDPNKVFSGSGLEDYLGHLWNLKQSLFFILNHADDLSIGCSREGGEHLGTLYAAQRLVESGFLLKSDGSDDEQEG